MRCSLSRPVWMVALVAVAVTVPSPARAQPTELFISEYVEGSSNNKALEIFNGTGADVNLGAAGYNVQIFFNGSLSPGLTIGLTGTVAAGDVFVLAQAFANAAILAEADQTTTAGLFNGDDAVVLRRTSTVIDAIGQVGVDPGTEWGAGLVSTADNTLRRKMTVTAGDAIATDTFDPAVEWDGFANNTSDGLGCHDGNLACPALLAAIWEIQGDGLVSPLRGLRRRTDGNVVTAVFSDGFFMQATGSGDGDPITSDGVWVYTGGAFSVSTGDQVDVTGVVSEYYDMTELAATDVTVVASGLALPAAFTFDENTPSRDQPQPVTELERFEGMLVRVDAGLASGPTNQFNEASIVATGQRAFREPGILYPGLPGLPVWDGNPEIFEIDTDRSQTPPPPSIAAGDLVTAEGPLAYAFGDYQIWPVTLEITGGIEARPVRARVAGELTVGSQNVLRLFDTVDDLATQDAIATEAEYATRLAKLSRQVREVLGAPDVLAVQEVENLGALEDLAARILADDPDLAYVAYLLEGNDVGGIDVGFLVRDTIRVDSVTQFGKGEVFAYEEMTFLLNDRPPLILRGAYVGNGAPFPFTVINVHQRSLGDIDDPDDGDRVRVKRFLQAFRLAQLIDGLQDADADLRLVVTGDFNAFEFTDGYVDVMGQVTGSPDPAGALIPATDEIDRDLTNQTLAMPPPERYTYVFDGTAESLDHALTSQPLDPFVRDAVHSRGNADAPYAFNVDPETALRSADHDGTVLFVMSDADADHTPDDVDACDGTALPEGVPTVRLTADHFALVTADPVFDTVRRGAIVSSRYTLEDTAGCSCEQILDRLGIRGGQVKYGCTEDTLLKWIDGLAAN